MSSGKYQKLFEPLTVGKLTIKNRISKAPLGMIARADPCGGAGVHSLYGGIALLVFFL